MKILKKREKSAELLWVLGTVFVALGVSICSKANLGVSMVAAPAFVVSEALAGLWSGFSVGVTEYIIQGLLLVVMCLVVRNFNLKYLLAFAVSVIYGYTLNLFIWLLGPLSFGAVWLRWVMLIVGDLITAFGVACFFRTYMPLQVYELFVAEIAGKFKISIAKIKSGFDISLLIVSVLLAFALFGDAGEFNWQEIGYKSFHSIGLGTILTTAINTPFITFMGRIIDKFFGSKPKFEKLHLMLKRD